MTYDIEPYTDPANQRVWCTATWTWRADGETSSVTGDYLDAADGKPVLCCGVYDAAADLDLPCEWFDDDQFVLAVSAKVDCQLAQAPRAELRCPQGTLTLELVSP